MVLNTKYIFLLVALIAAHLIFAQESSDNSDSGNQQDPPSDADEENGSGPGQRTFFLTRFTTCNSTSQAGRSCANCRQTLLCLSNNIGILKTCKGFRRYCNGGFCSFIGGSACNGTSSG